MRLLTTAIGAWPKPEYVRLPDWFTHPDGPDAKDPTRDWADAMEALGDDAETLIARGVGEAVDDQVDAASTYRPTARLPARTISTTTAATSTA